LVRPGSTSHESSHKQRFCFLFLFSGSFVALYRILLNAFILLFPANVSIGLTLRGWMKRLATASGFPHSATAIGDDGDRSSLTADRDVLPEILLVKRGAAARLSSAAQAHQTWLHMRSARWHSIVAGALAGAVAISFENRPRRKVIAQQLFVR
jgi:hypothetical protein